MDAKFEIETEYLKVLELTRKANVMSQNITSDDVEFKPILRIPKTYLTQLDKMEDSDQKEDIVGVLQRSVGSESETVMTLAEFEAKFEAIERMSTSIEGTSIKSTSSEDTVDTNMGDPFFNMQQHMLIGVASVPLNCIKSSTTVVEWDLPIVSPSGLKSGKITVNLQLIYVNIVNEQDSVDDDDIKLGSQICLKVDIPHVKELPALFGNFLFGQYDLFGLSQPAVFYSEDQSAQPPSDDCSEISVQFNHCQVHVVNVTEEVANIIDHGYVVIELWGHHGAGFSDLASDDESKPGRNQNHVQLWVQVLEKSHGEIEDCQPALVEDDRLTNTGGIFVLSKAKKKRLRVQLVSPSRRVRCVNISLLGVTQFSKEPVTNPHWGVQPYRNVIGSAWTQSVEEFEVMSREAIVCLYTEVKHFNFQTNNTKHIQRKTSQPHLVPSYMQKQNMKRKLKVSHTPGSHKNIKQHKEETQIPFLERRMSYPEDKAFSIDDISQMLQPMKCERHNEAIAEWNSFGDVPASCADSWFCDVIVKTTVQTVYCKTMEFILRKRICVKVLDDKQIDNYTSFITGYGGRKIGTKCGALFDISPKDTKHKTIDRRDSMAYIEVFKGENPDAVFMERLQHISELHKQRLKSMNSFDSAMSDWDMPKLNEEDENKKSDQSMPQKKLSRQSEIDCDILEEIAYEHEEPNENNKGDKDIAEESDKDDAHNLNRNTSNNNFNSFAVGERVIVQHESRYLFGRVRFIGSVLFTDKEQIGIELDQPYGKLDGTVNGVSYFRCKADRGIFTTRDKIVTNSFQ